ncbi:acetyltransferase [Enterococcus florum]|uniref:Acetyltransferase n=1 Tax=Enterococcus florum TaxID=2480627 RepID=A0A4P5P8R5_9ENTE|nr:GNAT family N-acetyltransferase [Enterococcus florum]GCF92611.1 acetyltransferase [Enterococcus florum]
MIRRIAEKEDYPVLQDLWERSVIATHDFLSEEDRKQIKSNLPQAFEQVAVTLWYDYDKLVGFTGTYNGKLEMFFLEPSLRQQGFGSMILTELMKVENIHSVDVNTQNHSALTFYLRRGFEIDFEEAFDDQGRPYPITHLKWPEKG